MNTHQIATCCVADLVFPFLDIAQSQNLCDPFKAALDTPVKKNVDTNGSLLNMDTAEFVAMLDYDWKKEAL